MAFEPLVKGWPTPDERLVVRIAAANLLVNGVFVPVAAQDVPVQPSTTNYVYYDFGSESLLANTTGFPANCFPIVIAVTNTTKVLSLSDQRPDYVISIG